eukprot:1178703-Prorocentrum_minimum.AAC.1
MRAGRPGPASSNCSLKSRCPASLRRPAGFQVRRAERSEGSPPGRRSPAGGPGNTQTAGGPGKEAAQRQGRQLTSQTCHVAETCLRLKLHTLPTTERIKMCVVFMAEVFNELTCNH